MKEEIPKFARKLWQILHGICNNCRLFPQRSTGISSMRTNRDGHNINTLIASIRIRRHWFCALHTVSMIHKFYGFLSVTMSPKTFSLFAVVESHLLRSERKEDSACEYITPVMTYEFSPNVVPLYHLVLNIERTYHLWLLEISRTHIK